MTGASAIVTAHQEARARTSRVLMLGGHVAALPERTLSEEACDFVARDEGLYGVSRSARRALRERETPDLTHVRGLVYRERRRHRLESGGAARQGSSSTRCRASPGICCR